MKIKLIKEYKLISKKLPVDTFIDVTNELAEQLILKGIAEKTEGEGLSEIIVKKAAEKAKKK